MQLTDTQLSSSPPLARGCLIFPARRLVCSPLAKGLTGGVPTAEDEKPMTLRITALAPHAAKLCSQGLGFSENS